MVSIERLFVYVAIDYGRFGWLSVWREYLCGCQRMFTHLTKRWVSGSLNFGRQLNLLLLFCKWQQTR